MTSSINAARRLPYSPTPPQVLSIAGSDPSGGAGIQADLKTFSSLGCYGMSVLTSLTAQNTCGVSGIHVPPVDFFRSQLKAIWEDVDVDAIKVGMLGNRDVIMALSEELQTHAMNVPVVLDPVMVSTSGSLLLTHESIGDLIKHLLPLCALLTPNLPEAQQLLSHAKSGEKAKKDKELYNTVGSLLQAANDLCDLGPKATLVKGGHQVMKSGALQHELDALNISVKEDESTREGVALGAEVVHGQWKESKVKVIRTDEEPYADILRRWSMEESDRDVVLDVLFEAESNQYTLYIKPYIQSSATHGTGCTLSSALAVYLATGTSPSSSTHHAIQYVQQCISRGLSQLGKGSGPLNHLCYTTPRPILAPTTSGSERAPLCSRLIAHSLPYWRAFTRHDFLKMLVAHTLPQESFIYFLKQDYLFLKNYARVWASGASSFTVGNTFARIAMFAGIAAEMAQEAENHIQLCLPWGITRDDLDHGTVESAATLAYTRFVMDVSRSGDALELLAATGPCLLGYGEVGLWLNVERGKRSCKPKSSVASDGFEGWIDYYAGKEFQSIVQKGIENMEEYACSDPPSVSRTASLQRIWNAAVRLEIGMWDEALHAHLRRGVLDP